MMIQWILIGRSQYHTYVVAAWRPWPSRFRQKQGGWLKDVDADGENLRAESNPCFIIFIIDPCLPFSHLGFLLKSLLAFESIRVVGP